MNWEKVKLGEICEVSAGQGAPQGDENFGDEGFPFVRAGSLDKLINGGEESNLEHIAPEVARKHGLRLFPAGTIVFAKSGMSATKGRIYKLKQDCYVVSHLAAIFPQKNASVEFLRFWLQFNPPSNLIRDEAYPSIRLSDIEALEIPLPPLAEQERIASLLDAADRLRAQRRDALQKLDALTHSLFFDAFGDPATNPKKWPLVKLGDVCKIERDGIDPAKIKSGTTYVGLENISKGGAFHNVQSVSNGDLASTKFVFGPRHVLYGKLRPYLAKIALPDFEGVCSTDILPLLPGPRLNRGYLLHFLRSPDIVELANSRSSGANLPRLSPRALADFEIPLPPLPLQLEFASRLEQIETVRARMERSALELDALFASLQNSAFGGS